LFAYHVVVDDVVLDGLVPAEENVSLGLTPSCPELLIVVAPLELELQIFPLLDKRLKIPEVPVHFLG